MAGSHTVNADSAKPGKKVRVKKARKNRKPAVQADQGGEIYNGVNIAGLSHVHQRPCLDESGNISLDDTGSCHQFTLSDLPEDARASIAGLPDGSYDDALGQVRRLADSALPVCVTRTNQDKAGDGDLATPGVNCREVK